MLRSHLPGLMALGLLFSTVPLSAQVDTADWTARPDSHAPAGVIADRLTPAGTLDARIQLIHHSFEDLMAGRNEVAPIIVLEDWDLVPLAAERQAAVLEVGFGLTSWMSVMSRVPFGRTELELGDFESVGVTSTTGIGDVEVYSLFGLHDVWPVRAHLSAGVSIPTGTFDQSGTVMSGTETALPYVLQQGAGTIALLPGATLVTENRYGTVGFQAMGRYHLDENDHGWHPGNEFNANLFMQYRFNDWIGGSVRLAYTRESAISGENASLDPFVSPFHTALATGGSRFQVPVGVNIHFAEGALRGNRLQAELLVPAHSDLNGPQLRESWGATVSWGFSFGDRGSAPARVAGDRGPIDRQPIQRATDDEPAGREESPRAQGTPVSYCRADGSAITVFMTPDGEILVGPERLTVAEAGGAAAVFGTGYAEGASWFVNDEPIEFDSRDFRRSGGEFRPDCTTLRQVGTFRNVPIFVSIDSEEPHDRIQIPVRPGVWQAYDADLARVRG